MLQLSCVNECDARHDTWVCVGAQGVAHQVLRGHKSDAAGIPPPIPRLPNLVSQSVPDIR